MQKVVDQPCQWINLLYEQTVICVLYSIIIRIFKIRAVPLNKYMYWIIKLINL